MAGNTTDVTETITLLEIASDKVVVEEGFTSKATGRNEVTFRPKRKEIPSKVPLPEGVKKAEFENKLPGVTEEGTETLKIAGGEFKTRWYKTKVKQTDGT